MKFKVSGSNKDTNARMAMEFEAESRGAAERKATQAGMIVRNVTDVSDGEPVHTDAPRASRRGKGSSIPWGKLILLLVVLAVGYYFFGARIRGMIGK